MPTERELDIQAEGAKKMQQVMRDRDLLHQRQAENEYEIKSLEKQLSAARDPVTIDPYKSRTEQTEARAKEMEAISGRLKQMAARQRELTQGIATKNATLREYGMTEEEIEPK
jgi:chromosome segregation ATPase